MTVQRNAPRDMEELIGDSVTDAGFVPFTGHKIIDDAGQHDRFGQITVERIVPTGATVRMVQPTVEVQAR